MTQTIIILSPELNGLGEVAIREGEFLSVVLNREGEGLLGEHFEDWQTQGVPAIQAQIGDRAGKSVLEIQGGYVQLRSPQFAAAFEHWLEDNGFYSLTLSDAALAGWNALSQLPLDPRERVMMAVVFRDVHPDKLPAWIQATERLVKETV